MAAPAVTKEESGAPLWLRLMVQASYNTIEFVESHGSRLSEAHKWDIRHIANEFANLAIEGKRSRTVFSLPTGCGKSVSILGFIKAVQDLNLSTSAMVCAEQVEHLCQLKRDLIASGVDPNTIGLIHSYTPAIGTSPEGLYKGCASEPATPVDEASSKQFLLVTHNKLKNTKTDLSKLNTYKGQQRNLVIWDESLISSEGHTISYVELKSEIASFKAVYNLHHQDRVPSLYKEHLHSYLVEAEECIDEELKRIEEGASEVNLLELPEADVPVERLIREAKDQTGSYKNIIKFLERSQYPIRAINAGQQGKALIWHEVLLPEEIDRMVILDASAKIRSLVNLDKSITHYEHQEFKKDYSPVTINYWDCKAGRNAIDGEFKRGWDNPFTAEASDICQNIKDNHPDDSILIVTFKERDVDVAGNTKKALINNGIDPDEETTHGKKRINFLTWGSETSLNTYSHCKHVIFLGVLHLPRALLAARITGQCRDLLAPITPEDIDQAEISELVHCIYQALSRGNSRNTIDGKAGEMEVYLFHPMINTVKELLGEVMFKAQWKNYSPRYLTQGKTKEQELAEEMLEVLNSFDKDTVSSTELKRACRKAGINTENNKLWTRARSRFEGLTFDWELRDRSFVRVV